MSRRADQSADNRADSRRAKRNPSCAPAAVMRMVNDDMMPRRAMMMNRCRTAMTSMIRRGNCRASRQRQSREKNRNRFDSLVHVTPTFPDFLSLHIARRSSTPFLTRFSIPIIA